MRRGLALLALMALMPVLAHADSDDDVKVSTQPLGSPFFRHLAFDFGMDIHDISLFEKKGFGRTETVTLVLIASATDTPIKTYGRRRLKERISLEDLSREAGLDYPTLERVATIIKRGLEGQGSNNLPPPVYTTPPSDEKKDEKPADALEGGGKDKDKKKEGK